jgi:hypothetical protein
MKKRDVGKNTHTYKHPETPLQTQTKTAWNASVVDEKGILQRNASAKPT